MGLKQCSDSVLQFPDRNLYFLPVICRISQLLALQIPDRAESGSNGFHADIFASDGISLNFQLGNPNLSGCF